MNEHGRFEKHANRTIEAHQNLEIAHEDQQFLCQKIVECSTNLLLESTPESSSLVLSGIALDEDVLSPNGQLYPPYTNLSMRTVQSSNAEPVATLELSGRNASSIVFAINEAGSWDIIRRTDTLGTHNGADAPTYSHASLMMLIESKLHLTAKDKRIRKDNTLIESERYKTFKASMDRTYETNHDKVTSLSDILKPFAQKYESVHAYSNDFYVGTPGFSYTFNGEAINGGDYQAVLQAQLIIESTNTATRYGLSMAAPYDFGNAIIQKAYHYAFTQQKGQFLPRNGGGIVSVSGKEVEMPREKMAAYAEVDQDGTYPVESLLRALDAIYTRRTTPANTA